MKRKHGIIGLIVLLILVYLFWPVSVMKHGNKVWPTVMMNGREVSLGPPLGGCFQSCRGFSPQECPDGEWVCNVSCYGLVSGTCVAEKDDKLRPVRFVKSQFVTDVELK